MHTKTQLKPNFYEFLIFMFGISFNIHILQSLSKFKIFIIEIQTDLLFIFLVLNAVFITVYHVKAIQDDISPKTVCSVY